jgi:hypothetical protein
MLAWNTKGSGFDSWLGLKYFISVVSVAAGM